MPLRHAQRMAPLGFDHCRRGFQWGFGVNYYKRHLGDYAKDTNGLTLPEHGAFTLLLDRYYSTEHAFGIDDAMRLCRPQSEAEGEAVRYVLSKFFTVDDIGLYRNSRADAEIAKAHAKAETNREIGKRGGRPCKSGNPDETQTVSKPNPDETQSVSKNNPSHYSTTPLLQETERACVTSDDVLPAKPKREQIGTRLPDDWQPDASLTEWAATERPDLNLAREIAGFRDYWHSRAGKDARKASWPLTFRNWIRNSRNGSKPQTQIGGSRAAGRLL